MRKLNDVYSYRGLHLAMSLSMALLSTSAGRALASQSQAVHRYKLLSSLEYSGAGQFSSQFETLCTVKEQALSDDKVQYFLSTSGPDAAGNDLRAGEQISLKELSFVIDGRSQHLSAMGTELAFLEKVSNQCVRTLKKVAKGDVGKTWKQGFDLSSVGGSWLAGELRFTLTAIVVKTQAFGQLIAVRALSEPFFVKTAKDNGSVGSIQCRLNCVYVFDPELEDIYLSVSIFKAATNVRGFTEVLQQTVATCKADAEGRLAALSDLGKDKDFEKFVSRLGVTSNLEVVKGGPLPQWAKVDGVRAAQVANICAAASCEGALNPVATVFLPAAHIVQLQSSSEPVTVGAPLAKSGKGKAGRKGAQGGWDWFGWNLPTAAWGAGITFGTLGAAGAFDEDHTKYRYRSPSVP